MRDWCSAVWCSVHDGQMIGQREPSSHPTNRQEDHPAKHGQAAGGRNSNMTPNMQRTCFHYHDAVMLTCLADRQCWPARLVWQGGPLQAGTEVLSCLTVADPATRAGRGGAGRDGRRPRRQHDDHHAVDLSPQS